MPEKTPPNKLSLEEERALVRLMMQGKEARRKLENDKGKLTADERAELLACVEKGEQAREKLILAHIGLVPAGNQFEQRTVADEKLILARSGLVPAIAAALCNKYGCWDRREELTSEGYFALIKAVDEFEPEKKCRVATYAYQRIWGALMNLLVREKFAPPIEYESLDASQGEYGDEPRKEFADPAPNQEQDLIRSDLLFRALRKLPETERAVIILRDLEGLSYEEIAERLEIPTGTVKSHRHRALAKLRVWLASPEKHLNGGEENA
jgi:RNA polymerase sigma-70 factor (ECF subfamily)